MISLIQGLEQRGLHVNIKNSASWRGHYSEFLKRGEAVRYLDQSCLICFESFLPKEAVIMFPCSHGMHQKCFSPWGKGQCPMDEQWINGIKVSLAAGSILIPRVSGALDVLFICRVGKIWEGLSRDNQDAVCKYLLHEENLKRLAVVLGAMASILRDFSDLSHGQLHVVEQAKNRADQLVRLAFRESMSVERIVWVLEKLFQNPTELVEFEMRSFLEKIREDGTKRNMRESIEVAAMIYLRNFAKGLLEHPIYKGALRKKYPEFYAQHRGALEQRQTLYSTYWYLFWNLEKRQLKHLKTLWPAEESRKLQMIDRAYQIKRSTPWVLGTFITLCSMWIVYQVGWLNDADSCPNYL